MKKEVLEDLDKFIAFCEDNLKNVRDIKIEQKQIWDGNYPPDGKWLSNPLFNQKIYDAEYNHFENLVLPYVFDILNKYNWKRSSKELAAGVVEEIELNKENEEGKFWWKIRSLVWLVRYSKYIKEPRFIWHVWPWEKEGKWIQRGGFNEHELSNFDRLQAYIKELKNLRENPKLSVPQYY